MTLSVWARNVLSWIFFWIFLLVLILLPFPRFNLGIVESRGSHCAPHRCLSVGLTSGLLLGSCQDRGRWLLRPLNLHPKAHRLNSGKCLYLLVPYVFSSIPVVFQEWMNQPGSPSPYPVLHPTLTDSTSQKAELQRVTPRQSRDLYLLLWRENY